MNIRQYISEKLTAFGTIPEAELLDFSHSTGLDLDEEYSAENALSVGIGMVTLIEEHILSPRVQNISESGFSMTWNFDNIGKYYIWLCDKYGIKPNDKVSELIGVSRIADKSDVW